MSTSSIIDNHELNTLLAKLKEIGTGGKELCIATAFFSLDALFLIADALEGFDKVRILFGGDADAKQRLRLLQLLRTQSDEDLLTQRESVPNLSPLKQVEALFVAGKIEARCYTTKKFHAKAYLVRRSMFPPELGVLGSGNFTRAGLTQNIELNVLLTTEQTSQLGVWFEERWKEAIKDDVTADVLHEIRRQIDLYNPYALYLKALTLWGQQQQDNSALVGSTLAQMLDPHQVQGYRQALRIIEQQHGVMVCDGVGLGKSFIALALMEKCCRDGLNVLLIAPKSILVSSWQGYLKEYLGCYTQPFGSIYDIPMTSFGFDLDEEKADEPTQAKIEQLRRLAERADVLVIDESHNFRKTSALRYKNLMEIVAPSRGRRKKTILLTATPINTAYHDMSAQLALITHQEGSIGGYSIDQIRRFARELDKIASPTDVPYGQLSMELFETPSESLNRVLESVLIQRSRKTCKALSEAAGKHLMFPKRRDPECVEYEFGEQSSGYSALVDLTDKRFRPGVNLFKKLKKTLDDAEAEINVAALTKLIKAKIEGIKLAAFLMEQYRYEPKPGGKVYQDEVRLAGLVFSNTLKQLESSPVAFQGILQSLGTGLIARLKQSLKEEADGLIQPHLDWVRTPLFPKQIKEEETEEGLGLFADPDLLDDGEALDTSGDEVDAWLDKAIRQRGLGKKLEDFNAQDFDVERWREDILADLKFLKEIHAATLKVRQQPDPKLEEVITRLRFDLAEGKRILVFTQSQRTAEYLERALKARLDGAGVARIDSRVEKTRAAILHAFCPGYNPPPYGYWPYSIPRRVDILISTDVLAEGVNLQEAGAILNYDIHWNPVRLIQRIGRVDRRLNPKITPETHEFSIYNVLPPPEIEKIIGLVGAVENRTLKISRTLGLDVSFFKSNDPAGNLKEFNSQYEGELSRTDKALTQYVHLTTIEPPDPAVQNLIDQLPLGAFGVWKGAPEAGVFALFTLEPTRKATEADKEKFAALLGYPVLGLAYASGRTSFDAGRILEVLSGTTPGEHSGNPSEEAVLAKQLKALKNAARDRFRDISLPGTIVPKLVCWIELKL